MFKSDRRQAFTEAISKFGDAIDYQIIADKIKKSDSLKCNAPLQDIMSAVSNGAIPLPAGHEPEYWGKAGKKQKEIFANLFTLECFNDSDGLEFVKSELPDVYDAYISMTAKKLGR